MWPQPVRQLKTLRNEGGDSEEFAFDYVGDFKPARAPHNAAWNTANDHWMTYNSFIMTTTAVPQRLTSSQRLVRAEKYCMYVLWALVFLNNCPECPHSAKVDVDKLQEIMKRAARHV